MKTSLNLLLQARIYKQSHPKDIYIYILTVAASIIRIIEIEAVRILDFAFPSLKDTRL